MEENTRFKGEDGPSGLDLIFTKEPEVVEGIDYKCPRGKSDHVVVECTLRVRGKIQKNEYHRIGRFNFGKLSSYFEQVDWNPFDEAIRIEDKWGEFMNVYNESVRRFVLKIRKHEVKKQEWFNK